MKYIIKETDDIEHANTIKESLKSNDGYCPCRIGKIPENKCMCQEFRSQLKDDKFEGSCHCGLYVKVLKREGLK